MRIDLYVPRDVPDTQRVELCTKIHKIARQFVSGDEGVFVNGVTVDRPEGDNEAIHCVWQCNSLAPGKHDQLNQRLALELSGEQAHHVLIMSASGAVTGDSKKPVFMSAR